MEWKSVVQIAAHLGVSKETIYRLLESEEIPAYRVGKLWKFEVSQVDAWVKKKGSYVSDSSKKSVGG